MSQESDSNMTDIKIPRVLPDMKTARNCCFTLNNYTAEDICHLRRFAEAECKYMIFGKEIGAQGTPHLQGYFELKKLFKFKKLLSTFPRRAHLEKRRGSAIQASEYCEKEDKEPYVFGKISKQGERVDILALKEAADAKGATPLDLWDTNFCAMLKYHAGMDKYLSCKQLKESKKFVKPAVIVLFGVPGSGKSRWCYDEEPALFKLPCPSSGGSVVWFDGYAGESTLLLDDFYGGGIKYSYLLQLLDGYPMQVQVKGGFTVKAWNKVYITSNTHPRDWYPNVNNRSALMRRIAEIITFELAEDEDIEMPKERKIVISNRRA